MTSIPTDICPECGRDVLDADDFRDANRTFCIECDRYIVPAPGSPLQAWVNDLPRIGADMKADWHRSKFHLVTEGDTK